MSERKKIHKVITDCLDCEHCKEYQETSGNTSYCALCMYGQDKENRNIFLLVEASRSIREYAIPIPENCPLEDYPQKEVE